MGRLARYDTPQRQRGVVWLTYTELARRLGLPGSCRVTRAIDCAGTQLQEMVGLQVEGPGFEAIGDLGTPQSWHVDDYLGRLVDAAPCCEFHELEGQG